MNDTAGAGQATMLLHQLADESQSDLLQAQAEMAQGAIARQIQSPDAIKHFQAALEILGAL